MDETSSSGVVVAPPTATEVRSPISLVRDGQILFALLLLALCAGLLRVHLRPDTAYTDHFLFADHGLNLLAAQTVLEGRPLYTEVFYYYGPVPIYCYSLVAAIFGNTPSCYVGFQVVLNLIHLALVFLALRSCISLRTTLLVVVLGAIPIMLFPVATHGAYTGAAYIPFERCCIVGLVLAWTPPANRTALRAVLIGAILGFWQWCKFGGCFYAGFAIVLLDMVSMWATPSRPWKHWLGLNLLTLTVFLGFEIAMILWALAVMPEPIALDFIWPHYVLETYAVVPVHRWPQWWDWYLFLGAQWTPLVGLGLGLAG